MVLIFVANDKSKQSLHPHILNHCSPGSVIVSDKMASYVNAKTNESHLEQLGYTHFWVNHTTEWVNDIFPEIHTNTIERTWRSLKSFISHTKRSMSLEVLETYINAFLCIINSDKANFYSTFMDILRIYINDF
jgi:hypothetical protein